MQSNHKITCMLDRFPLIMISGYLFNSIQGNPQGIPLNSSISVLLSGYIILVNGVNNMIIINSL